MSTPMDLDLATPDIEPSRSPGRGTSDPSGLADVVLGAATLLLLIANAPSLDQASPVLLSALLWPLGAAGLCSLLLLARRGDRAARWGSAALGWALISAVLSSEPRLAFDAGFGADRGWVYLASFIGCWALGRRRGAGTVRLVTAAIYAGLGLNVLLALLQAASQSTGLLGTLDGRVQGFTMNPVFLGALMSGGLAMSAAFLGRADHRWWAWLGPVAVAATITNMTGTRSAMAGGALLAVLAVRRAGWLKAGAVVGAVVVGFTLGALLLPASGTGRLSNGGGEVSGITARKIMWRAGVDAAVEHPVFGWGPNRFRPATNRAAGLDFVIAEGPERLFFDAHNLVVEHLVATGFPGLVLLCGFGYLAARRARGPLAWYAAGIAITWLLEPVSNTTAPTAMLALGLAAIPAGIGSGVDPPPADPQRRTVFRVVTALAVLVASFFSLRSVYVAHLIYQSADAVDPLPAAERAASIMPNDDVVIDVQTQARLNEVIRRPTLDNKVALVRSARRAAEIDPTYDEYWNTLARMEGGFGPGTFQHRLVHAQEYFERSLSINPLGLNAMRGLFQVYLWQGRVREAGDLYARLCTIDACPRPHA